MKKLFVFFVIISLFSCEKICLVTSAFCKDKIEKPETIDFSQVDAFPCFKNCDSLLNYTENKICFEKTLHQKINNRVQNLKLKSDETLTDTIYLNFSISKEGSFMFKKLETKNFLLYSLPNLNAEIQEIIHGLAPITPAQKRGIPVTTTYTIPLVIQTNETFTQPF